MAQKASVGTQKPKAARSRRRVLVKRGIPPVAGASKIIVIKRGEDLLAGLKDRYALMQKDLETVEFFWNTLMKPEKDYSGSKEWPEHLALVNKWELHEGVKSIYDYRAKMRKLKVWIDHFQAGRDYELTVDEVVEIQS
jgi:hypothetical protein